MTRYSSWLFGVVVLFASSGCAVLGFGAREFTIAVDSVTGPLTVAPTEALTQFLYGPVGANLCAGVKSVKVARTATGFDVVAIGTRSGGGDCPAMPSYMDGRAVTVTPPYPTPLLLRVRGAGGSWIERTIRVE